MNGKKRFPLSGTSQKKGDNKQIEGEGCFDNDKMKGKFNQVNPDGTTDVVENPAW